MALLSIADIRPQFRSGCYLLFSRSFPALFVYSRFTKKNIQFRHFFFKGYFIFLYTIAFLICSADIPYYKQFGSHFNKQFALWMESPGIVLGLIFSNFMYWGFLIVFILCSFFIAKSVSRIFKNTEQLASTNSKIASFILFIFLGLFTFIGIRGRTSAKSPIRIGTAFFSEYYFFNQLGLNPCFVFIKSITQNDTEWGFLKSDNINLTNISSFNKDYTFDSPPKKYNVVIVLMESMAITKMGYYGCKHITTRFDSLIHNGVFFDHFYSAGIHTFNGVFSTETGFPGIMDIHPLNTYNKQAFKGISYWLKRNNYSNYFFTSHDAQFDNLEGFMKFNYFDRVYSQVDYPSDKVISTLGVPDHYLFGYALDRMNEHFQNNKTPFFSFILSSTDHTPWEVPDDVSFKPSADNKQDRATQYADWAIGNFIDKAKKYDWFNNTIFIFVADHGMNLGHTYAMPLSYNHIPCLFYMPSELKSDTISSLGGQIDIFPTLMSILKIPFKNSSMGIDLFHEKRSYMYFSADTKMGCIDDEYYYIHLFDENKELLYKFKDLNTHNYIDEMKSKADSMKNYTKKMIKVANYIIEKGKY